MYECSTTVGEASQGSRKRNSTGRKREKAKQKRYSDPDPGLTKFRRPCLHRTDKLKCLSIDHKDIERLRKSLYKTSSRAEQNKTLATLIIGRPPKRNRRRSPNPGNGKPHKIQLTYRVSHEYNNKRSLVTVCKAMFQAVTGITSTRRLLTVSKSVLSGDGVQEKRGGDRKSHLSVSRKNGVRAFLRGLKCSESHYNRKKSKRVYLPGTMTIRKLWKAYNNSVGDDVKVKREMFRLIFVTEFNIGFSSPASDVCSLCTRLGKQLKEETDAAKKVELLIEKRVHKLRAGAFFEQLRKEEPDSKTFCFDLQQVQPLPKTPIQEAFYARQISYYPLCCVGVNSLNPVFYTWTDAQSGRGANEVASAIFRFLTEVDLSGCKKLRLFADGCGAQNKNNHVVHMLLFYLQFRAPMNLTELTLTFPVRGHSFLPADRVFGRVEKELTRHSEIVNVEKYSTVYNTFGKVCALGTEWKLYDFKDATTTYRNVDQISQMKRLVFTKEDDGTVSITPERYYKSDTGIPTSLLKRGKRPEHFVLKEMQLVSHVSAEKRKDVLGLLESIFGKEWQQSPELQWYVETLKPGPLPVPIHHEDSDEPCMCTEEEELSLRI